MLFTMPHVPVTRTQYLCVPFDREPVLYVLDVAPLIGVAVDGDVPRYHRYVRFVPVAVTESVVDVFLGMLLFCGCAVIAVPAFTVTLRAALVALQPLVLRTVTV